MFNRLLVLQDLLLLIVFLLQLLKFFLLLLLGLPLTPFISVFLLELLILLLLFLLKLLILLVLLLLELLQLLLVFLLELRIGNRVLARGGWKVRLGSRIRRGVGIALATLARLTMRRTLIHLIACGVGGPIGV